MKSFKWFLTEAVDVSDFPMEIFDGFSAEVKKSTSKMTTIVARTDGDRDTDRDEILKRLNQLGVYDAKVVSVGSQSIDPIDGTLDGEKFRILVKPTSGGMTETTLNANITELFPCIAFEKGQNPTSVDSFMQFLRGVDINSLSCLVTKNRENAKDTINRADTSSNFKLKMQGAIGILKYLRETDANKKISNIYWAATAATKPSGVPKGHPGDIFIKFQGDQKVSLGVSLKSGGKKTKEPALNTYVRKVFKSFNATGELKPLEEKVYNEIYAKISDEMPSISTYDGGKSGRGKERKKTREILLNLNKTNKRQYETYYDQYLSIMRNGIVDLFNSSVDRSADYIKKEILRDAPTVPTIVMKALEKSSSYEEVTDTNELGVFLPQVTFIRAYTSSSSKQNWHIDLKSGTDELTMNMSIRTNNSGDAGNKKLGQFSLAIKYNGISTK